MDEAEARRRMASQSSQAEKIARADRVINNDDDLAAVSAQLDQIWQEISEKFV
jgi:dephospho-CoA kinase